MSATPKAPAPPTHVHCVQPIKLPIGVDDFAELVRGDYTFVDKTQLIEEVIGDGAKVTLIVRPRRFGKTLNLSMLQYFFAPQVEGQTTAKLFDGLHIAGRPAAMSHQGQYSVIFLTLKDIDGTSLETFMADLRTLLSNLYNQYLELWKSADLEESRRGQVRAILDRTADRSVMSDAIRLLSELLYKHYRKKVVILLDEYDAPIHAAFDKGYYPQLLEFLRPFMSRALKGNRYLHQCVTTGILQVSEENMFSGLNHFDVYTVLDNGYSRYFGFTQTEVTDLLATTDLGKDDPHLEGKIKDWYNGYRFGADVIYNPWSIVNCLKQHGSLEPYWLNTSRHELLKKLMAQSNADFKADLERLLRGEPVEELINRNVAFAKLKSDSTSLLSLLLFSGYLTTLSTAKGESTLVRCQLAVPNREVSLIYRDIVQQWFTDRIGLEGYTRLLESLAKGDAVEFALQLGKYLLEATSYFDVHGQHPENFYHALLLGMIAGLSETHVIESNRESGYGRFDIALFPKRSNTGSPGIVLELKQTSDPAKIQQTAQAALEQIQANRYDTELRQHSVQQVSAIGLGFCGKQVAVAYVSRAT